MKKIKDFEKEPVEFEELRDTDIYRKFIREACKYADRISLSFPEGNYSDFQESKWGFLKDNVIDYEYTSETPVTEGPVALMLYLKINNETYSWLYEKKGIYDFMDYEKTGKNYFFLYDLCFIKENSLVFCSCSHEKFCYVISELKQIIWQ